MTHSSVALPALDGVEHRMLELPGLRMHVALAGSGSPVVLLHGFPQHWWMWRDVIGPLAARHRVVVPDLRGAGWTDAPRGGYDDATLVGDLLHLLDALRIPHAALVGHDWGAIVAALTAMRAPDRVDRLVLAGVPHPFVRMGPEVLPQAWRLWFQPVIAAPGLGPRMLAGGRQRLPRHLLRGARGGAIGDEHVERYVERLRDPARARAGAALYRRLILPEARRIATRAHRDDALPMPVLVVVGDADPVVRPSMLAAPAPQVPQLRTAVVKDASHFVVEEQPAAFNTELLAFLE